jgi:hypothetical protein
MDKKFISWFNRPAGKDPAGIDGPYVIDGQVYRISDGGQLSKSRLSAKDPLVVERDSGESFEVYLNDAYPVSADIYAMPRHLLALSDIEGNFEAFTGLLMAQGVIDKELNWTFGEGHLVLLGDFTDRGEEVTQLLWLIYKLEQEALKAGGRLHFILGNHEVMNMEGDWRYNHRKYIKAAMLISGNEDWSAALRYLYSAQTELGQWLRSKNVAEKIGDYLFVHAGISPEILPFDPCIELVNRSVRESWDRTGNTGFAGFLRGNKGPYWYRGMAGHEVSDAEMEQILSRFQVQKLVIGHTVVKEVTTAYEKRLLLIDVKHVNDRFSSENQGFFSPLAFTLNSMPFSINNPWFSDENLSLTCLTSINRSRFS